MLYFNRFDVFKEIDVNKTSEAKESYIYNYWYFSDKGFKFEHHVCNGCHDVLMITMNLSNIAILNIHGVDCMLLSCHVRVSEWIHTL